jgi:hypothetical protein
MMSINTKFQRSLLAGLTVACLWSAAHAAESPKLAQIKAVVGEYRQKSFGPLAGFAGVYDISKTCQPFVRELSPNVGDGGVRRQRFELAI